MAYSEKIRGFKAQTKALLGIETLEALHRRRPWRHFAVAGRQWALLIGLTWLLGRLENPLYWLPVAAMQGCVFFGFTVLLHEVVHKAVFAPGAHPRWNRLLGRLYALPSGLSATQFTRWHLDHHRELGSTEHDPKRAHLSPKRNRRWIKLLYFTPALFGIYFRAAARETATYPEPVRHVIRRERLMAIGGHLAFSAALWTIGGPAYALRAHWIPLLVFFPIFFAINRLGQHYHIRPDDPAEWITLMRASRWWGFWFLNSHLHREHHYYPGVPMYNLPRLHRRLAPFYRRRGSRAYGYGELLYGYLVRNEAPHTDWEARHGEPA